jgi:hypothetical protein
MHKVPSEVGEVTGIERAKQRLLTLKLTTCRTILTISKVVHFGLTISYRQRLSTPLPKGDSEE